MTTRNLLFATYMEPEHVERVRRLYPELMVIYEPALVPPARYPADHYNTMARSAAEEARWRALLSRAEILFDFDPTNRDTLPDLVPNLRWIQATSAGIGQSVAKLRYAERMPGVVFTTTSGVHAVPLAEFCSMAMLAHSRGLLQTMEQQRQRHWQRYAGTDLVGRTLGIIGVGRIGREVARHASMFGMRVLGLKRQIAGVDPASLNLTALYAPDQLLEMVAQCEYLVLVTPHTPATEQLLGARELAALPQGAYLINIGRGACLNEAALLAALQSGHLSGAALDVFENEPLPAEHPFWAMPNVLVSPHSASTSDRENTRIMDLFCENIRRYLAGQPLLNVLDTQELY